MPMNGFLHTRKIIFFMKLIHPISIIIFIRPPKLKVVQ